MTISLLGTVVVILGIVAMTIAVVGVVMVPDRCVKVHAATKGLVVGLGTVLAGVSMLHLEELGIRALIIITFLLVTSPVGAHALIRLELGDKGRASEDDPS